MTSFAVATVGSVNEDTVIRVDRPPHRGETVLATSQETATGGKGANQAMAAARVGPSALIATVGTDTAAGTLMDSLKKAGVSTETIAVAEGASGQAYVQVTPDGENAIVVLPQANASTSAATVSAALKAISPRVILAQLEIPIDAVAEADEWAESHAARFVLNASPVAEGIIPLLRNADPVIVNAAEARQLTGRSNEHSLEALAIRLAEFSRSAVVTGGALGVAIADGSRSGVVLGRSVVPIDTTGAGDAFAGTLAGWLARGDSLFVAATKANDAAAKTVQVPRSERDVSR